MNLGRNRQHHSEQLRATIFNPSAFKRLCRWFGRSDSKLMFESATSSFVPLLHGKPSLSDGWP